MKLIAKLLIPKKTPYCYTPTKRLENGYKIRKCPYWKQLKEKDEYGEPICYCRYLKSRSEYEDPGNLIWDMVKECGINDEWEEEE